MLPFLIELAKAIRQFSKDSVVTKINIEGNDYYFIRYGAKVNIQVINKDTQMCDNGWWLLPTNEVYAYEGH